MAKRHLYWLLPIALLILISPFTPALDLAMARYFYAHGQFVSTPFEDFIFSYAVYPAFGVGFLALGIWPLSYFIPSWRRWSAPCAVLVLSMALGAGFIAHTLLKDRWGRPRPRQVVEFGGVQPFRPYYEPNFFHQPEPSKSFPCGHCTMGFYFFALALVCQRQGLRWGAWLSYFLALFLGIVLGVTRMAQGGHFFSDVLVSAILMWLIACFFDRIFCEERVMG